MKDDSRIYEYPEGISLAPVHPGKTLAAELAARGLTANALALKLRVPSNRLSEIVREQRGITAETALRLGHFFGTGGAFWINLQAQYDLATAHRELGARIAREVETADRRFATEAPWRAQGRGAHRLRAARAVDKSGMGRKKGWE
jgi:addiction module HigA family antidote